MPHKFSADPTITITIPAAVAEVLANWASVSRTIQSALDNNAVGLDELEEIGPTLDAIHQLVRSALWATDKGRTYYKTRLDVALDAARSGRTYDEMKKHYESLGVAIR